MSTNTNPDAVSASSTRDNPCYGSDSNVASLNVFADDEHSYLLPYAQLLYAETIPNPAVVPVQPVPAPSRPAPQEPVKTPEKVSAN